MNQVLATGRCVCGLITYAIDKQPLTLYACHCTDCQTASGASFTLILRVTSGCVRITNGETALCKERERANGKVKKLMRCPQCLTALWGFYDDNSRPMSVYAGTLDRSSELAPVGHIWTNSAQPWICIPKGTLSFSKQPPDMEMFYEAWTESAGLNSG